MNKFTFLKVFNSPFKTPKIKFYVGKIKVGTPYFYPRKWVDNPDKPGYKKAVPKKIGFDFVGLGWKTKWSSTDYRFEWNPVWSFVLFKWQIAVIFVPIESDHYWEAWLYYYYDTKGTQRERIEQCKKEFPLDYKGYSKEKGEYRINYYDVILKDEYKL